MPEDEQHVEFTAMLRSGNMFKKFNIHGPFRTTIRQNACLWLIRCTRCALLAQSAKYQIGPCADVDSRQDAGALRQLGTKQRVQRLTL
jgi:tRNA splicing ligase